MRWSSRLSILAQVLLLLVCALTMLCATVQKRQAASPTPIAASSAIPEALTNRPQPEFFVMIDPSHGGNDKGAVLSPRLMEKDVTLALARALRKELEQREIPARLLRESDVNLSLEHRAEVCNQQLPGLYVALHAGTPGKEVRVYAPLLPSGQPSSGSFLPWDTAQAAWLERSNAAAKAVTQELQKKRIKAQNMKAFLRPLNNVISPAIAIEVAVDRDDIRSLESAKLQDGIASAVAASIAQTRVHVGGRR